VFRSGITHRRSNARSEEAFRRGHPLLDGFKSWLTMLAKPAQRSALAEVIGYRLKRWQVLARCVTG